MIYSSSMQSASVYEIANWFEKYFNAIAHGLNAQSITVDPEKLLSLCSDLKSSMQNFPHTAGGFLKTSPFKKAGYFFSQFIAISPIVALRFPTNVTNPKKLSLSDKQLNVLIAYLLSVDFLSNATVQRTDGQSFKLTRIKVSPHFMGDTLNAFQNVTHQMAYPIASVFFEALAYIDNTQVSYPRTI